MDEIKALNSEQLCEWLKLQPEISEKHGKLTKALEVIHKQEIDGDNFPACTQEDWERWALPGGGAKTLVQIAERLKKAKNLRTRAKEEDFEFRYVKPGRFCDTLGSQWKYQPDISWKEMFDTEVVGHYDNWKAGKHQKIQHPLFLCLSGPGTGKSRLLDEFHGMLCNSIQNEEIREMLRRAFVFHASFENGTAGDPHPFNPDFVIGGRMMYQMVDAQVGWNRFAQSKYYSALPEDVISFVCKESNVDASKTCVLLLVDGLQMLEHDDKSSKHTQLYQVITSICNMINRSTSFVVACCASTVYDPVTSAIASSPQRRIYLKPPSINPELIFTTYEEPVLKLLMHDMGGHGRALEAFSDAVEGIDLPNTSLSSLGRRIMDFLVIFYPEIPKRLSTLETALKIVISRKEVRRDERISEFSIDDMEALGLFTYDAHNRMLNCAFVALSLASREGVLPAFNIGSFSEIDHNRHPENFALGLQCWQHWEEFNCRYRCLKSECIQGSVAFSDIHRGAEFGVGCSSLVESRKLKFGRLPHHRSTKSETKDDLSRELETFFKSADGNPSGDAFCMLKMKSGEIVSEVHQYKHIKGPLTNELFSVEYEKAATKDTDFFVYITTTSATSGRFHVPARCALVDESRWKDYFGPYWARGFYLKPQDAPLINDCNLLQLTSVYCVGTTRARLILTKRPYDGAEEAYEALERKVPMSILKRFRYN